MGTLKLQFDLKGQAQFTLGRRLCSARSLLETMPLKSHSVNVQRQSCIVDKLIDSRAAVYVFSGRIMHKVGFCSLSNCHLNTLARSYGTLDRRIRKLA